MEFPTVGLRQLIPGLVSDDISTVAVEDVGLDVHTKFGCSRSNFSQDIRSACVVQTTNDEEGIFGSAHYMKPSLSCST